MVKSRMKIEYIANIKFLLKNYYINMQDLSRGNNYNRLWDARYSWMCIHVDIHAARKRTGKTVYCISLN